MDSFPLAGNIKQVCYCYHCSGLKTPIYLSQILTGLDNFEHLDWLACIKSSWKSQRMVFQKTTIWLLRDLCAHRFIFRHYEMGKLMSFFPLKKTRKNNVTVYLCLHLRHTSRHKNIGDLWNSLPLITYVALSVISYHFPIAECVGELLKKDFIGYFI